jgi:hypothetical protein
MESLIARWQALSLPLKALTIVGFPFVIAFLIFEAWGEISHLTEDSKRKTVDQESKLITEAQTQTNIQTAQEEGKLGQLKADKERAVQNADSQDPASFYNNRKPD